MYISIDLRDKGETRLYLQPQADDCTQTFFVLVEENDEKNYPLLLLELKSNSFIVIENRINISEDESSLNDKLNSLAIDVLEAIQQGRDLTEKNTIKENNPYDPDKIRVETKTFSLRQIYDMISDGDINLSPDFQRHLVWDNFRKSRLIESILLRIPLPMFYFSQDNEGVLSVVDGLQRLTTIKEFMDNKYPLRDLEYLSACENKYYSTESNRIDDKYTRWFNMTQITVNIVDPQSPFKVKYDIFRRINTGGKPLNSQELRNCLAHNDLRRILKEMANSKSFIEATGNSISDVRMDAQELALRFIFFYDLYVNNNLESYSGLIDTELDSLVDSIGKMSYEQLKIYVDLYESAMKNAIHLFGKHAFRKVNKYTTPVSGRSQINKALFVSWSVLLSQLNSESIRGKNLKHSLITPLGIEIDNNGLLLNLLSYGTNGKRNIIYAFDCAKKIITEFAKI